MLWEAINLARDGRNVYVMGASFQHAVQLARQAYGMARDATYIESKNEVRLPSGIITFKSIESLSCGYSFDWSRMRYHGTVNAEVLVDHYAIETEFAAVLAMLHRWDLRKERGRPYDVLMKGLDEVEKHLSKTRAEDDLP